MLPNPDDPGCSPCDPPLNPGPVAFVGLAPYVGAGMSSRVHMTVRGLVQRVGFRYFVARRAESYGLAGFVRNRPDGSVEIEAEGERTLLEQLVADVRRGPRSAQVTDLTLEWEDLTGPGRHAPHFSIR